MADVGHNLLGPVKLSPIPVARPWGGVGLCTRYNKPRPQNGSPLGESWEASDLIGAVSQIASGPLQGAPVSMVFRDPLSLLIKFIDARQWLSLQVHPDEEASRHLTARRTDGKKVMPKHEAWHVLWAEPGAEIVYGTKPGVGPRDLLNACAAGQVDDVVNKIRVHVGDTIHVPAGTVHAIGPGIILYEVQQPSNSTFRLFDWGRMGLNGKPRRLHLHEAMTAVRPTSGKDPRAETALTAGPNPRINLLKNAYFRIDLFLIDRGELVIPEKSFMTYLTVSAGHGWMVSDSGQLEIKTGDTILVPGDVDYCLLPGDRGMRMIRALPGKRLRRR